MKKPPKQPSKPHLSTQNPHCEDGKLRPEGNDSNSSLDFWGPNGMALWDPFKDFPQPPIFNFFPDLGLGSGSSVNTFGLEGDRKSARVDVVFPCFINEDVLVELQDDRVLQLSMESGDFMSRLKLPNMHNGVPVVTVPKFDQSTGNR